MKAMQGNFGSASIGNSHTVDYGVQVPPGKVAKPRIATRSNARGVSLNPSTFNLNLSQVHLALEAEAYRILSCLSLVLASNKRDENFHGGLCSP